MGTKAEQVASIVTLAVPGQVIVGGVLSTLFTVNEQVAVFPLASCAVRLIVTVPTPEPVAPNGGLCKTVGVSQLSDNVAGL